MIVSASGHKQNKNSENAGEEESTVSSTKEDLPTHPPNRKAAAMRLNANKE